MAGVVAGAVAVAVPITAPAGAAGITVHRSTKHTVARGVQWWTISWTNDDGYQHGYVMSVDLSRPTVHLKPGMADGNVNDRTTTLSTAGRIKAIGGVNGDLFNWSTYLPWGGIGIGGSVFKTPARGRPSQFYIRTDGKAGIGPLVFSGVVRQVSPTGTLGARHVLSAVNTPGSANAGNLTVFTPAVSGLALRRCAAVSGPVSGRDLTVRRVFTEVRQFDRLKAGHRLLAACGAAGQWLLAHAPLGQHLRIRQSVTTPSGARIESFLSGQRVLRQDGKPYNDTTGFHTTGINPETAACVSKDRLHVLLISIDGWLGQFKAGQGVTLTELGQLAAALHCYSTVVFDGGGSTTMVARRAGTLHLLNKVPQYYGQRPVPNGLFVVKS